MYVSSSWSKVYAFNASTGSLLWKYDPHVPGPKAFDACCDVVNRGVAVLDSRVFVGTVDGRLIALDSKSGLVLWSTLTVDASHAYSITGAPRVFENKVIIGNAGSEYDVRGYVSAYQASTGKLIWRFYTVPGDPKAAADGAASDSALATLARPTWYGRWYEHGGGGAVWDSIVIDAQLNRVYIGVGNGTPWDRRARSEGRGDNLFLASIVALDADTGEYRWHYQVSPGDSWDFDACQNMILAPLKMRGRERPVLMQASKNGFFYVIDRGSGKLISANNFVPQNWTDGIDLVSGRPRTRRNVFYEKPNLMIPGGIGGHTWHPMAYSPETGLVYIPAQELPLNYAADNRFTHRPHAWNTAIELSAFVPPDDVAARKALRALAKGELIAWDPIAQREVWRIPHDHYWNGGVLATAGNLLFQGGGDGEFHAYRADDGRPLWNFRAPSGIIAAPATYAVGDRQYVAVLSGWGGIFLNAAAGPTQRQSPPGRVLVFQPDGKAALPPYTAQPLPPPNPARDVFIDDEVALGKAQYTQNCAVCHGWGGIGGDIVPDLRRSRLVSAPAEWHAVVSDGALANAGMIGFKKFLSSTDVEAIRAYISHQATLLQADAEKKVAGP
jgi:PQQ-dependent dehydrogenase (methanol/ethanol family)